MLCLLYTRLGSRTGSPKTVREIECYQGFLQLRKSLFADIGVHIRRHDIELALFHDSCKNGSLVTSS